MEIKRDFYLNELIDRMDNGLIKIVTGIRRCGKSYLLDPIFKDYLIGQGVEKDHIIKLSLDERANSKYLDPDVLDEYIRSLIVDNQNQASHEAFFTPGSSILKTGEILHK